MDEWWIEPLRRVFDRRRVVLAGAVAAAWIGPIETLRSVGAEDFLVVASEGRGAGPQPDVTTVVLEPPDGLTEMERIHHADRTLHEPPPEILGALDRFDPQRRAVVVGTFLGTTPDLAGRPLLAHRRPEWVALEDKVVIDAFWDRAGIDRQPSIVVGVSDAAAAAASIDRGDGTVWAADAREGFHGGARHTRRVRDRHDVDRAVSALVGVCDAVRVMPFVEGIPCSIHGIVLPDGIAVLRPVEMVTLRRGDEFVYAGCATYWDPPATMRRQMRSVAERAGARLAAELDFRGTFTVDGVAASDGFWPTELNPRFGAGIMTIARGTGIPMVLVNDLIVAGVDLGRSAEQIETDVVTAGDTDRHGGTWTFGVDHDLDGLDRPVSFRDGRWSWTDPADDAGVAGRVTAGDRFVRCIYERSATPVGPSTAPRAAAFWDFVAAETGADTAGLTAAGDPTSTHEVRAAMASSTRSTGTSR